MKQFVVCFLCFSFIAFQSVLAESVGKSNEARICAKELEGIVYAPDSFYEDYLRRISKVLLAQTPLMFQNPALTKSIVDTFSSTYSVEVQLIDAMGNLIEYENGGPIVFGNNISSNMGRPTGRSNALGEAFSNEVFSSQSLNKSMQEALVSVLGAYVYQTIAWNVDGRMLYVRIILYKPILGLDD